MAKINFFTEEVTYTLKQKNKLRTWINRVIKDYDFHLVALNYIFCSDKYLLDINQDYLNHDTLTDIITFDNSLQPKEIEGDIFISIERIEENAVQQNILTTDELHRVMIHGLLHLLGFDDKTSEQKKRMREKEDACLSLR